MELQTLQFFATVARCQSMSKAAEELSYAQSNLSTKISLLEKSWAPNYFTGIIGACNLPARRRIFAVHG